MIINISTTMRKVDYSKLLSAFWGKRLVCTLTSCEADMYYYLLKQCDLGNWANPFKLPTKKCEIELDFTRKTISNVRNSLQQKGFINFKPSRVRGEVAEYEIVGLDVFLTETQTGTQTETQTGTQTETQTGTQTETQTKEKGKEKENLSPIPPIKEKEKEKERCLNRQLCSNEHFPVRERKKAVKEYSPCHKGRQIFEAFYLELYGEPYYWQAKDAKAMNSILKKISYARSHRAVPLPVDVDSLLKAWEEFLRRIDKDWIMNNFSVNKIDSQYNEIISEIKNHQSNANNGKNFRKESGVPRYASKDAYDTGFGTTNG